MHLHLERLGFHLHLASWWAGPFLVFERFPDPEEFITREFRWLLRLGWLRIYRLRRP